MENVSPKGTARERVIFRMKVTRGSEEDQSPLVWESFSN